MAYAGQVAENPFSGERIVFRKAGPSYPVAGKEVA
jgi:hypothetical protein